MRAIDILARDHERIKNVLALLESAMRQLEAPAPADVTAWRDLVGLCEQWVDRAHVLKEEEGLFPLLKSRGLGPEITVVSALLAQHQTGQAFLRQLRAAVERLGAGDEAARADVIVWARDYVELVREHMRIEDHYFYDLADGSLTARDDAALIEKFERIDRAVNGSKDERERWAALLAAPASPASPR